MVISLQGLWHYNTDLNNQDFFLENDDMVLVLDGCSEAIYSDAGTRTFVQHFKTLKDFDKSKLFEDNINLEFEKLIKQTKEWYPEENKFKEFITNNYLFTILACFRDKDCFVVKIFGDGYIVTKNIYGMPSYITLSYGDMTERGKQPPYYAYKYCNEKLRCIDEYKFKTFKFDYKKFEIAGVATDGIKPIAKGGLKEFDKFIDIDSNVEECKYFMKKNKNLFDDDCTIGFLSNGGK